MSNSTTASSVRSGSAAVFWVLTALALTAMAPCIVVPEWQRYRAACLLEREQIVRVRRIQEVVEREKKQLVAISSDPAAIARLAQRDLNLHKVGEIAVSVTVAEFVEGESPRLDAVPQLPTPPRWVQSISASLPQFDYAGLFGDDASRTLIFGISTALLAVAFALFSPRSQRQFTHREPVIHSNH